MTTSMGDTVSNDNASAGSSADTTATTLSAEAVSKAQETGFTNTQMPTFVKLWLCRLEVAVAAAVTRETFTNSQLAQILTLLGALKPASPMPVSTTPIVAPELAALAALVKDLAFKVDKLERSAAQVVEGPPAFKTEVTASESLAKSATSRSFLPASLSFSFGFSPTAAPFAGATVPAPPSAAPAVAPPSLIFDPLAPAPAAGVGAPFASASSPESPPSSVVVPFPASPTTAAVTTLPAAKVEEEAEAASFGKGELRRDRLFGDKPPATVPLAPPGSGVVPDPLGDGGGDDGGHLDVAKGSLGVVVLIAQEMGLVLLSLNLRLDIDFALHPFALSKLAEVPPPPPKNLLVLFAFAAEQNIKVSTSRGKKVRSGIKMMAEGQAAYLNTTTIFAAAIPTSDVFKKISNLNVPLDPSLGATLKTADLHKMLKRFIELWCMEPDNDELEEDELEVLDDVRRA
ncbi:hypothetical protein JCM5296_003558 [Sporobolomyces johnsonii]